MYAVLYLKSYVCGEEKYTANRMIYHIFDIYIRQNIIMDIQYFIYTYMYICYVIIYILCA